MSEASVLTRVEPQGVWKRFLELTAIPRPSKEEERARRYVLAWAEQYDFETGQDEGGNLVVRVPATIGRERAPIVVLQSHLDMVCERDPGSPYDPREGRIHVVREDDWVLAEGTTLGADNGIGVAAAMAVAEDAEIAHGPLELLFTVSEEQGLDGAKALDSALVNGRRLLNLDGTSDDSLTIGCAGSAHAFVRLELGLGAAPTEHAFLSVRLNGVRGGHSGGDIARGRINAIKALGRVLSAGSRATELRLGALAGGVSRNAIPRDAQAVVSIPAEDEQAFREAVEAELQALRRQHAGTDDGAAAVVEPVGPERSASPETSARALDLLAVTPTGVVAMSPDVSDTVETSSSLNVAQTSDGVLTLASMTRSANAFALEEVVASLEAAARLAGASTEVVRSYPPWEPDRDSGLLAIAVATFGRELLAEPRLEIVHGGLECAVIGSKLPGVEMLSLGPTIEGPHAPGERLSISGTQRFYGLLGALLDDLST